MRFKYAKIRRNMKNIHCKAFLSKKLRDAIKNNSSIQITINNIENGSGRCDMVIDGQTDNSKLKDLIGEETSLIFRVLNIESVLKSSVEEIIGEEENTVNPENQQENVLPSWFGKTQEENKQPLPENIPDGIESFFINRDKNIIEDKITKKIAVTEPPEIEDISNVFESDLENIEGLEAYSQPEFKKYVSNLNEFYDALEASKNKKSTINLDAYKGDIRKMAVMEEQKRMEESIGKPAYVVNKKYGTLRIEDLNLQLNLNSPIDLARMSANTLIDSKDLRSVLRSGLIEFVSPQEATNIEMERLQEEERKNSADIEDIDDDDDEIPSRGTKQQIQRSSSLAGRDPSEIIERFNNGAGSGVDIIDLEDNSPSEESSLVNLVGKPMPSGPSPARKSNIRQQAENQKAQHTNRSPIKKLSPVFKK